MLQSPDGMRRCGAALVLAELAPKNATVVKALGAALPDANQLLTRYILEAFEAIGTRATVPYVLPLLESPELETKLRAASIVARVGGDMVQDLARLFAKASPDQRRVLVDILARIHTTEAWKMILDLLFDPDFELVKETCQAVRRHMADTPLATRMALHRQLVRFMHSSRVRKEERVLTSCLLLVGYVGAPDAGGILLKFTVPRHIGYIRRHALLGLKGLELKPSAVGAVARAMFKYLSEADSNIAQHALDILERLPLPKSFDREWRKLLRNKHPSVRAFAARKIAAQDTVAANRQLVQLLHHADTQISEIAMGALGRHRRATKVLLGLLARERKAEPAWRLAKILKHHSEWVDKKTLRKFGALAGRELEAERPRHEALFYFLRNVDPAAADRALQEVGIKCRKSRKWARAVECLRPLVRTDGQAPRLRYDLSVCQLKLSPKDLAPPLRAEDQALRGLQSLLQVSKFPLLGLLTKEKVLDAADLFYLGFHFAEGNGAEQKFGHQVLQLVTKRWPRSKEAGAARNKLKILAAAK
ncbi:hypothetical protein HQ590_08150 [bacterium]|nr:hypothetical protein [bacterium]